MVGNNSGGNDHHLASIHLTIIFKENLISTFPENIFSDIDNLSGNITSETKHLFNKAPHKR